MNDTRARDRRLAGFCAYSRGCPNKRPPDRSTCDECQEKVRLRATGRRRGGPTLTETQKHAHCVAHGGVLAKQTGCSVCLDSERAAHAAVVFRAADFTGLRAIDTSGEDGRFALFGETFGDGQSSGRVYKRPGNP